MKLLSERQKRKIEQAIKDHHLGFIAEVFGPDAVPKEDYTRLVAAGKIRPKKAMPLDAATAAHVLGILARESEPKALASMAPKAFWSMAATMPGELSPAEREAVAYAKDKIGQHIKGLGNKIDEKLGHILIEADEKQRKRLLAVTRREVAGGLARRASVSEIAKRLRDATKDAHRNWLQIASTEVHTAIEEGKAAALMKTVPRGSDPLVYKRPYPDACFPPGVLVLTQRGNVPVETVVVGDYVLTHRLRWRRVTCTLSRPYDGALVTLSTRDHCVPMTARHPVLANKNWALAEALQEGDDVITLRRIADANDQPAFSSEQSFLFNIPFTGMSAVVPSCESVQLYRDLLIRDGNVDIVFADCKFWHGLKVLELVAQQLGFLGHGALRLLLRLGFSAQSLWRACRGTGEPSAFRDRTLVLVRHVLEAVLVRLFGTSERDSVLCEPASDSPSAHAVLGRQVVQLASAQVLLADGFDGQVQFDRHASSLYASQQKINTVANSRYTGQVYNLDVDEDKSYFAGGIAVHNCPFCKLLYLKGKVPRVFHLSELVANGTNVGRRAKRPSLTGPSATEWKAVLGAMHPWCRCELHHLPEGMGFDAAGNMVYVGVKKSLVLVESLDRAFLNHECLDR